MKCFITAIAYILIHQIAVAQLAPSWVEFVANQKEGKSSILPDYSFAGYHFSEKEIPDVSGWAHFNVTDYGAVAGDELYDDAAIQATIDAAEASNAPAVVFFPAGRFVVSENSSTINWIQISRDSIVLKGSGSGAGGTELFMDKMRVKNGHWQFAFQPKTTTEMVKATLIAEVKRGDFSVFVETTENLEVGQTIHIYHKSEEFAKAHFGDLELSDDWYRLFGSGGGMAVHEPHTITAISGNRVTFKNPIQVDLPELSRTYVLRTLTTIQEVGVEDILFTSNWENYGEEFEHHKDDIHDYAWNALQFENVRNGWIRNCEFRSWSQSINVTQSIGVTIQNVLLSGKKGHASISTRRGFGLLVKDCEDLAGQHHGPGTGYQGVNTVYLRYKMQKDQSIDSHSGQPYVTLMDDVQGGDFDQNGGPHDSYPHHGQHLTFWNFRHSTTGPKTYNFWQLSRNGFTYARPLFVGFQPDTDVIFLNEGLNEMKGQMVEPRSLFDAQLDLRLSKSASNPTISFLKPGNNQEFEIGGNLKVEVSASDPDGSIARVALYLNEQLVREDTEAPYVWGEDISNDPLLFNMPAGVYQLRSVVTDNSGLTVSDSIEIIVGRVPDLVFQTPARNSIIEAGKSLKVEAQASDTDGSITSVALYFDGHLVRILDAAPFVWGEQASLDPGLFDLSSGEHTLRLEAVDNDGLTSIELRSFIVNVFPEVSFTTPTDQQVFEFGSNIPLNVVATDADGGIVKVDMFINNKFHREELTPPYDWGLRIDADPKLFNLIDGEYVFKAVAYDSLGSNTSVSITVVVKPEVIPLNTNEDIDDPFSVYPNPFKNFFSINTGESALSNIQFYTIEGRDLTASIVFHYQENHVILSAPTLNSGMYFVSFKANGKRNTIRLIKE